MTLSLRCLSIAVVLLSVTSCAEVDVPELPAYRLPANVRQSLKTLAGECDVLVIGEIHGTKEVPAVVEGLLGTLNELGYRVLALEVPHDEQAAITAWATGGTDVVPAFFARPGADGRGNQEVLALVRRALGPPYAWKLICFDTTEEDLLRPMREQVPHSAEKSIAELAARLSPEDINAISLRRDATMAENFAAEREKLPPNCKVVAVCGNVHARTANHAPAGSPLKALWPSFAAVLKRDHAAWKIRSLNVQAFSGEYFNGGKVNTFIERPLADIEARLITDGDWDWELNLPRASAATLLAPPAP